MWRCRERLANNIMRSSRATLLTAVSCDFFFPRRIRSSIIEHIRSVCALMFYRLSNIKYSFSAFDLRRKIICSAPPPSTSPFVIKSRTPWHFSMPFFTPSEQYCGLILKYWYRLIVSIPSRAPPTYANGKTNKKTTLVESTARGKCLQASPRAFADTLLRTPLRRTRQTHPTGSAPQHVLWILGDPFKALQTFEWNNLTFCGKYREIGFRLWRCSWRFRVNDATIKRNRHADTAKRTGKEQFNRQTLVSIVHDELYTVRANPTTEPLRCVIISNAHHSFTRFIANS
jgi:hypothetical protein